MNQKEPKIMTRQLKQDVKEILRVAKKIKGAERLTEEAAQFFAKGIRHAYPKSKNKRLKLRIVRKPKTKRKN